MENNYKMLAKTLYGFEDLLEQELRQLGAMDIKKGVRNVSFVGDKGFMYKANMGLRTAIKILKPIKTFRVHSEQDLYDQVYKMRWDNYLKPTGSLAVDATLHSKVFTHSKYVALKTKDAIVDKFRNTTGQRPNVDLRFPDLKINVHIDRQVCTISLDTSGESLHKRGYKTATNIAPINEVLAAGLVMLSGWDGQTDFMDPMCGSGTILIEAAMIACNIPPNLMRKEFAFERWDDWDVDLFEKIEESLLKKTRDFHHKMIGYDKSPSAISKAKANIKNAHLEDFIKVQHEDFFKTRKAGEDKLHMLFNPPYGERLNIDMQAFYKAIGDTLKQGYPGTDAWFITSNLDALKYVGLRPSRKIHLFNAKLESRLVKYVMYEGSKKAKYQNSKD
ncbi:THUMP domain-containing class I SAM-dependent RNA methyltransferase [Psychroserpens sp.]|uniref:THUMP domain-containing class I SAM-dependent RNA methyltransferase n=1 Tax=Psychroserpens sp. TaxID=2020870 RepID=UPI001B142821|nr:THUMP domain-containing protein [Psychroserpens sp.]MBO6607317.1 class I SAM-dependent RNA methyltransferase [Psychroserpens sp.]MBO6654607.1 class I SAM-dependent RNA methyltransferase [Psychroserpens sp.]MBO6681046.1 class I SAM-dependent RNA methyltransferase [Psychroserpens sp.]MBO6749999.1 class I SAM-dependent RNA methyltransferase [Psychroserpens sp.]MBO6916015.1 class I SAM-dependent RNA methyltransferase [Psychroserpens sp.]